MARDFGANSVLESIGSDESIQHAMRVTHKGGHMPFVGRRHGLKIEVRSLLFSLIHPESGLARPAEAKAKTPMIKSS